MADEFYSIRMRANRLNSHLSGAERLVRRDEVEDAGRVLLRRALSHSRGDAEQIILNIDRVPGAQIQEVKLPHMQTMMVADWRQGRRAAIAALVASGVSEWAASRSLAQIAAGAGPGGTSMRGAMLVDASSGQRLEADSARGVRASRMDIAPQALEDLHRQLTPVALDNGHVREALVLAAKVLSAPGLVAELCWSDDLDYTAGYVASSTVGYRRFPHLKAPGDERGGRVFFIRPATDIAELYRYLEEQPVLVTAIGDLLPPDLWRDDA